MKQTMIWNFVGFLGLATVFMLAMSIDWKTTTTPLEYLLALVLLAGAAGLSLYLGAEDEEN